MKFCAQLSLSPILTVSRGASQAVLGGVEKGEPGQHPSMCVLYTVQQMWLKCGYTAFGSLENCTNGKNLVEKVNRLSVLHIDRNKAGKLYNTELEDSSKTDFLLGKCLD